MESHPYEKTRGEGVPGVPSTITLTPNASSPESQSETAEAELCRHIDARGHRCRMLVMTEASGLCVHHEQRSLQEQREKETAEELLACGTDFADAPAANRFLGALVRQVTLQRIPRRDAVTLAYICQLLLN